MTTLFAQLKARPLPYKALIIFLYGVLSFSLIWLIGNQALGNPLLFRLFELLWFLHIVIIANRLAHGSTDLIVLAVLGLSPGLLNNVLLLLNL